MLRRVLVGIVVLFLAGGSLARAQDEVYIRGKEKEKPLKGQIGKESPKDITVGLKDFVLATDIIDVKYAPDPLTARFVYNSAFKAEKDSLDPAQEANRKANLAKALKDYEDAFPQITTNFAKRHVEYKIAMLRVRQAQEDGEDPEKAIKKLSDFTKSKFNRSGWQITSALQTLARLQVDAGKFDDAAATLTQIADNDAFSEDARQDARLSVVQTKLQAGKFDEARDKLKELQGELKQGSRFFARAKVAEAECLVAETKNLKADAAAGKFGQAIELVKGVIKESNDPYVKAVGHNTLGYCYLQQGQAKDAVWEFLWVDVVYNQDRTQHAKALYHLWQHFTKEGDASRSQEFRESLMGPQFNGTEWQRMLKDVK